MTLGELEDAVILRIHDVEASPERLYRALGAGSARVMDVMVGL